LRNPVPELDERAASLTNFADTLGGDREYALGSPAAFGRRIAELGRDESAGFEAIQRGVDARHRDGVSDRFFDLA
jgi:hypothetical protein